jgi:hypothetical protein
MPTDPARNRRRSRLLQTVQRFYNLGCLPSEQPALSARRSGEPIRPFDGQPARSVSAGRSGNSTPCLGKPRAIFCRLMAEQVSFRRPGSAAGRPAPKRVKDLPCLRFGQAEAPVNVCLKHGNLGRLGRRCFFFGRRTLAPPRQIRPSPDNAPATSTERLVCGRSRRCRPDRQRGKYLLSADYSDGRRLNGGRRDENWITRLNAHLVPHVAAATGRTTPLACNRPTPPACAAGELACVLQTIKGR